jgi:transposase
MQAAVSGYEAGQALYMALELSNRTWRLGFSNGQKIRQKSVEARALSEVLSEIRAAKAKLGLVPEARVVACYEAGRDGHWISRWLSSEGVEVLVMDSSSIEHAQGRKHVKTDGIDVERLLDLLMRYCLGFRRSFRVVRVPDEAAEASMRLHREDAYLVKMRGRVANRIRGLLAAQGLVDVRLGRGFEAWLDGVQLWNGAGLSEALKSELKRLHEQHQMYDKQLRGLAAEYKAELESSLESESEAKPQVKPSVIGRQRAQLELLKGIGPKVSRVLSAEAFSWRRFKNQKQVGSMAGLTPTPEQSGNLSRERGIGKHGNPRVRHMAIELAWLWLRWQPDSALSKWFGERFGGGGKRMRRIGIVALARKLLIALWKYLEQGVVPAGAVVKPA